MFKLKYIPLALFFGLSLNSVDLAIPARAIAQLATITQQEAQTKRIDVYLHPGQVTTVDFSSTRERISSFVPIDKSRFVYNLDDEIGLAETIFLAPIEKLDFPGQLTSYRPNISIKTIDEEGKSRIYNLVIHFKTGLMEKAGVRVVPNPEPVTAREEKPTPTSINIGRGEIASVDEVDEGLKIAIQKKYTPANDPIVTRVKNFTFFARNGQSVTEAINTSQVDPAILIDLVEIARENRLLLARSNTSITRQNISTPIKATPPEIESRNKPKNKLQTRTESLKQIVKNNTTPDSKDYQRAMSAIKDIENGMNPRKAFLEHKVSASLYLLLIDSYYQ